MNAPLDAWRISADDYPDASTDENLWFFVRYAILAPSTHNSQPWLFRIHGNIAEVHADLRRALPIVDPEHRELVMSCGAALFHLRVAIEYFGHSCSVELFPDEDPNLVGRIQVGLRGETSAEDIVMFNAIPKRRTNRLPFLDQPVPEELLAELSAAAEKEGAWLHVIQGEESRQAMADLVSQADRIQWKDRHFRTELAHWLHPNREDNRDGIPAYAQGMNRLPSYAGPFVIRTFDLGKGRAATHWEIAVHSPVLAVLGTDGDARKDWVGAGQALAAVLLRARAEDVWASFLNQPIEVPDLRPSVASITGRGGFPQLVLRMGYGSDVEPTPRRSWRDVIVRSTQHTVTLTPT